MDYRKEALRLARDFVKYRKMQDKLVKLRSKPPSPNNIDPVRKQITDINHHLVDMDKAAAVIINFKSIT